MFENPRRGRQARNFTTNVPKILDRKSSSGQIFSENCRWMPLKICSQLHPLCEFDTVGDWFRGRIVHLASNLDAVSSNSKAVFIVVSLWNVIYIVEDNKLVFFSVSPQSRSLFSASRVHTFCLTARVYLNTQKYGLFCSLLPFNPYAQLSEGQSAKRSDE